MKKRVVNIIKVGIAKTPLYATQFAAGADLYSANIEDITIQPMERVLIPTGIMIEMPNDAEAQVRPRSGLSLKKGLVAILGTIDSDYQGEVGIILINMSNEPQKIQSGERLAQIVFNGDGGLFQAEWHEVTKFSRFSDRGGSGFGSTGVK